MLLRSNYRMSPHPSSGAGAYPAPVAPGRAPTRRPWLGSFRVWLALAALPLGAAQAQLTRCAPPGSAPDSVAVELRLGSIAADVALALRCGDDLYVSPRDVLRLLGRDTSTASSVPAAPAAIEALAHASVTTDCATLTVTIADSGISPTARRARRAADGQRTPSANANAAAPPVRLGLGPFVVHYSASSVASTAAGAADVAADLGLAVAWLRLRTAARTRPALTLTRRRAALETISIGGDERGDGLAFAYSRTAPTTRAVLIPLASHGPRADVDAFDASSAIDVVATGERSTRSGVLLTPGTHVLRIVQYDDGTRRESIRTVTVPDGLLPAHAIDFRVAARCIRGRCFPDASFDAGIAPRASLQLTTSRPVARTGGAGALATARLTDAVAGTLELHGRAVATSVVVVSSVGRAFHVSLSRGAAWQAGGAEGAILHTPGWRASASALLAAPGRSLTVWSSVDRHRATGMRLTAASGPLVSLVSVAYADSLPRRSRYAATLDAIVAPFAAPPVRAIWPAGARILASLRVAMVAGALHHSATLTVPLPRGSVTIGAARDGGARTRLSLTMHRRTGAADLVSTLPDVRAGVITSSVSGALSVDAHARELSVMDPDVPRVAVQGTVYLDRDRNGRRDPGEAPIEGVVVRAGATAVVTDSAGRYAILYDGTADALVVELDPLSLPDGSAVPRPLAIFTSAHAPARRDIGVAMQGP